MWGSLRVLVKPMYERHKKAAVRFTPCGPLMCGYPMRNRSLSFKKYRIIPAIVILYVVFDGNASVDIDQDLAISIQVQRCRGHIDEPQCAMIKTWRDKSAEDAKAYNHPDYFQIRYGPI